MVGYTVTLVIEPGNLAHKRNHPNAWSDYRQYIAGEPGPKIVVVQDLDKPMVLGSFWGEVNSNVHRALGCVGTVTDGAIRDLDEMTSAGFKAIARRLCVGHAHVQPVRWNCDVEVFGCKVTPGQLIHADKHGFLAIPPEDENQLLEAALFMDSNECRSVIEAARNTTGLSLDEILVKFDQADREYADAVQLKFGKQGE
jgi:regulator of RNase E activity RraA